MHLAQQFAVLSRNSIFTKIVNEYYTRVGADLEVIDEFDLDVIHMHYAIPHAVCGILAREMSVKKDVGIITTLHGTDITVLGHDMSLVNAIKFGIEHSDITTSVSDSLKVETYDLIEPKSQIETVYNFVDESRFNTEDRDLIKAQLKEKLGIPSDAKVIMHTSNFRKIKNVNHVVKSFELLAQSVNCHLVFVGDGPDLYAIRQMVKDKNLQDITHFIGQETDVTSYYKLADIFLLLSSKESFGLAMLEAMYCGAVPIGSTAGGISEVIKHGETGYIVDVGDYQQVASHIKQLLNDDDLYKRIQENMLIDVKERFDMDTIVDQYEALYQSIMTGEDNE